MIPVGAAPQHKQHAFHRQRSRRCAHIEHRPRQRMRVSFQSGETRLVHWLRDQWADHSHRLRGFLRPHHRAAHRGKCNHSGKNETDDRVNRVRRHFGRRDAWRAHSDTPPAGDDFHGVRSTQEEGRWSDRLFAQAGGPCGPNTLHQVSMHFNEISASPFEWNCKLRGRFRVPVSHSSNIGTWR